jgi:hypothetical protein
MYKGEPQRVSARAADSKCLAKPKSAIFKEKGGQRLEWLGEEKEFWLPPAVVVD